uniref:Putative secreted protein n=1 Tax=Anopheles marajoara TaxID=58244 RepID=A0A2M4CB73_9DIPT
MLSILYAYQYLLQLPTTVKSYCRVYPVRNDRACACGYRYLQACLVYVITRRDAEWHRFTVTSVGCVSMWMCVCVCVKVCSISS